MEPFYWEPAAKIYNGDALDILKSLPDESIQMVMTSPPYWGLRNYAGGSDIIWGGDENCEHIFEGSEYHEHREDVQSGKTRTTERFYGEPSRKFDGNHQKHYCNVFCVKCGAWRGQLGLEPTPELYVEHLMMIFREVKRVLRKEGSFYLNIGDTYSATRSYQVPQTKWHSSETAVSGVPMSATMQPKCMVCIPERVMFAMIEEGWILRNKCIWHKPNSMPGSQKDRFTTSWEYLYFFTKNNKAILWRNRETGEWRDTRPTRDEKYPWGGMYQNPETLKLSWQKQDGWLKLQPLWMGFDYYFHLDAVRVPHKTQSVERYQRQKNFDASGKTPDNKYIGEEVFPGSSQIYRGGRNLAPEWFKEMFPPDGDYKGKFDQMVESGSNTGEHNKEPYQVNNPHRVRLEQAKQADIFGHGPNPQSFNLRVRDVKRGKGGVNAQSGELRASQKEIREYDYPERARKEDVFPGEDHNPQPDGRSHFGVGSVISDRYKDSEVRGNPKGKNPGDYLEITTQPTRVKHYAVFPERLCERPIKASSRVGDVVLDPLAGTGTVGVVAKRLGRKVILIDIATDYCGYAKERISKVVYQPELG